MNVCINKSELTEERTNPDECLCMLPLVLDFQRVRLFLEVLKAPCPKQTKSLIGNTFI